MKPFNELLRSRAMAFKTCTGRCGRDVNVAKAQTVCGICGGTLVATKTVTR